MNAWYLELLDKTSTKEELNKIYNLVNVFNEVCEHLQVEPTTENLKAMLVKAMENK